MNSPTEKLKSPNQPRHRFQKIKDAAILALSFGFATSISACTKDQSETTRNPIPVPTPETIQKRPTLPARDGGIIVHIDNPDQTIVLPSASARSELFDLYPDSSKKETADVPSYDLFEAIQQAHKLLRSDDKNCELKAKDGIILAVKQGNQKEIKCIKVSVDGAPTDGFKVTKIGRSNGINSRYKITKPKGFVVLAVKDNIPVMQPDFKVGEEVLVYTPFSPDLNQPALRQRGFDYLKNLVEESQRILQAKQIKSRFVHYWLVKQAKAKGNSNPTIPADQEMNVTEVVPVKLSIALAIIEHIDDSELIDHSSTLEEQFQEVLTVIGANSNQAYSFAVSTKNKAGARGLMQFTRKTYDNIVKQYPAAKLDPNFISGTRNHRNVALASVLLHDENLHLLNSQYLSEHRNNLLEIGKLLAATYNGGQTNVNLTLSSSGEAWAQKLPNAENRIYAEKLEKIWLHFLPLYMNMN